MQIRALDGYCYKLNSLEKVRQHNHPNEVK